MIEKKVVVIDGNNLFSRGFVISKNQGQEPFRFVLQMILNLKNKFPGMKFVFTFDTTKSKRRLEIYPEYKSHRKTSMTEEEYLKFKEVLNDVIFTIKNSGYITLEGFGYEADDYIACICNMLKIKYEVIIVSTDGDLLQMINDRIRVFNPIKVLSVTHENFESIVEIKQKNFLDYKCILGDDSDNISGIEGIGEKLAKKYISEYGSYENIVEEIKKKTKLGKREQSILNSEKIIERNRQLMDLTLTFKDENLKEIIRRFVREILKDKKEVFKVLCQYDCSEMIDRIGNFA